MERCPVRIEGTTIYIPSGSGLNGAEWDELLHRILPEMLSRRVDEGLLEPNAGVEIVWGCR